MIRLLSFSTLYPNRNDPKHGIFVEHRLRKLVATGRASTVVVAPMPWVPPGLTLATRHGRLARVPARETRHGIEVHYPTYPIVPRLGMYLNPITMLAAMKRAFRRIPIDATSFDVLDAHYLYPDGVVASRLGKWLGKPVVITARGTDVNLLPQYAVPRRRILEAAAHAKWIITVSDALRERLMELGVPAAKIVTLRNGVDLDIFRPLDRDRLQERLGMTKPTLLSVGHLNERKGHHFVIEAMRSLPGFDLVIVGDGPFRRKLEDLAQKAGLSDRVRFAGALPQAELVDYYNAADALVLASSREGMANVLLESLACGTPVVATAVWGSPEVVRERRAGVLVDERSGEAIARGVSELFSDLPDRAATRAYAEGFSWDETTAGQLRLFEAVCNERRAA